MTQLEDLPRETAEAAPVEPYIAASRSLPEITVKAVLLGIVLSMLLAGANAYLGLKAGMTVSASIPAAVISMAVLRIFRRSNILENNIVQTAASAGESLAAGVIFTMPALVLLKVWTGFNYWPTTIIAGLGGMIGVLFTIPLRRALIVESPLRFPEGVATAEVLKIGDQGGAGIKSLVMGGVVGALFKVGESGFRLWAGVVEGARQVGGSLVYVGTNASPALLAVGYIVGINIAVLVFLGGALNWFLAIPVMAGAMDWPHYGVESADPANSWAFFAVPADHPEWQGQAVAAADWAGKLWSSRTRYLGVGAMVVGGLWALFRLWRPLVRGVSTSVRAYRSARENGANNVLRTDRDAPMQWVGLCIVLSVIPLFFVFNVITGDVGIAALMAVIMLIAGFLFSAVASYMAGLVGSSNNPISGVTIATLLTSSLLLFALGMDSSSGPAAAILIGAVVCCAAAIGGDNMQDLKAGQIVGATPWKQQVMQSVGVLAAAVVMAPILSALLKAYGLGDITVEGQEPLQAPQATLMQSVAEGVFAQNLPWSMVWIGMAVAVAVILLDLALEFQGSAFRTPVLAVAVGIYLPLELSVPILFGGLIAWGAHQFHVRRISEEAQGELKSSLQEAKLVADRNGLLMAAGLITGEALLGITLAVPLAIWEGENRFAMAFSSLTGLQSPMLWPGIVLLLAVMVLLYVVAVGRRA